MQRTLRIAAVLGLVAVLSVTAAGGAATPSFKNVIVLVLDGCGSTPTTVARWVKGAPLALDRMHLAGVRTYGAESIITDSAPAATAFACGHKTSDKFIGMLPDAVTIPGVPPSTPATRGRPVASVLEGARLSGRATGIVATSQVQHATPAAYTAHTPRRSAYDEIAEQQVHLGMDVVLGGGRRYLLPPSAGGTRADGDDLVAVLRARGAAFVETREAMLAATGPRLWGAFARDDMAHELDRPAAAPDQPSLAEMTRKAIDVLAASPRGFFLMVEGSKADWAAHAHDPAGVVGDVLAFDAAVGVALDFAGTRGDTLVLAFADHATGGMSLGSHATDRTYAKLPAAALVAPLKAATITAEGVARLLAGPRDEAAIRRALARYGIADPAPEELAAVQHAADADIAEVVGPLLSKRSAIGWTTGGHTGEDLFLYHHGLDRPLGMLENTGIAHLCAAALGFDLAEATDRLFQPAAEAFAAAGATLTVDASDPANKVLVARRGGLVLELPVSTSVMTVRTGDGRVERRQLDGVVVHNPLTDASYVPRSALAPLLPAAPPPPSTDPHH